MVVQDNCTHLKQNKRVQDNEQEAWQCVIKSNQTERKKKLQCKMPITEELHWNLDFPTSSTNRLESEKQARIIIICNYYRTKYSNRTHHDLKAEQQGVRTLEPTAILLGFNHSATQLRQNTENICCVFDGDVSMFLHKLACAVTDCFEHRRRVGVEKRHSVGHLIADHFPRLTLLTYTRNIEAEA